MGRDQLFCCDRLSLGKEPGQLRASYLPQAIKRLDAGISVDLNQAQPGLAFFVRGEPVQQLAELQLVQQIMLEPEHYVLVLAKVFQRVVTNGKCGTKLVVATPSELRERAGAYIR